MFYRGKWPAFLWLLKGLLSCIERFQPTDIGCNIRTVGALGGSGAKAPFSLRSQPDKGERRSEWDSEWDTALRAVLSLSNFNLILGWECKHQCLYWYTLHLKKQMNHKPHWKGNWWGHSIFLSFFLFLNAIALESMRLARRWWVGNMQVLKQLHLEEVNSPAHPLAPLLWFCCLWILFTCLNKGWALTRMGQEV